MEVDKYLPLFKLPLQIDKNIAIDGWFPSESDIDDEFISRQDFDAAIEEYNKQNENVIFSNTYLSWDSCDCGDGYGCSHGSWIYEVGVTTNNGKDIKFETFDDNCICLNNGKKGSEYMEINTPMANLTVGDFYRMCQILGIELKFTDYGKSLIQ